MKVCPTCGASYEPHVEYCFVDGSALAHAPIGAPPNAPPGATTGVPPSSPTPRGAPSLQTSPPAPAPPPSSNQSPLILLLAGATVLGLVLGGVMIGTAVTYGFSKLTARPIAPATPVPPPSPLVPPPPVPSPAVPPAPVSSVTTFRSTPEGAMVLEDGLPLCPAPCSVPDRPGNAPRTFVLRKEGHLDQTVVVDAPGRVHELALQARSGGPSGAIEPSPTPPPAPPPKPPRRSLLDELETSR